MKYPRKEDKTSTWYEVWYYAESPGFASWRRAGSLSEEHPYEQGQYSTLDEAEKMGDNLLKHWPNMPVQIRMVIQEVTVVDSINDVPNMSRPTTTF